MSEHLEKFLYPLTPLEQQVAEYVEPILASKQAELLLIRISGLQGRPLLTLFVDKVSLDELANLTRFLCDALDVADAEKGWFHGAYQLELSSPGLDRPLTKKSHFQNAKGQAIKVKTSSKTLRGQLTDVNSHGIKLSTDPEIIPWEAIKNAHITYIFPEKKRR